jgi:hypothetical protein
MRSEWERKGHQQRSNENRGPCTALQSNVVDAENLKTDPDNQCKDDGTKSGLN